MRPAPGQLSMAAALGLEDPVGVLKVAPPQTQLKHAAYRNYLGPWLNVMKGNPGGDDLFILDLYAGPGAYLVDGKKVPGSPVIAAELAVKVQAASPDKRVHLRCVERNRDDRELLEAEIEPFRSHGLDVTVDKGTAQGHSAAFAAESVGHPTLVLLDPNGIGVPMDLIARFGGRGYTEALISFDAHANHRVNGTTDHRAVTAFWGDESWTRFLRRDGSLDLGAMLEGYRERLQTVAGFHYGTMWRIRFPRGHIDRAIGQAAGSTLAGEIMFDVLTKQAKRFDARILEAAEQLDRRGRIDGAIGVMANGFQGQVSVSWSRLYARVAGVCPGPDELEQALFFMRERGHVAWTSRLGRYVTPPARLTFEAALPDDERWDGVERSEARTRVATGVQV